MELYDSFFGNKNENYQPNLKMGSYLDRAVRSATRGEGPRQDLSGHLLPLLQSWRQLPRAHCCPPRLHPGGGEATAVCCR